MPFYHADPVSADIIADWYFAPLLPWQYQTWQYFTENLAKLPHAVLLSGSVGTGKRAFAYRFLAWALCENRLPQQACGYCESCQWLKSGTHPNILIVPPIAPILEADGKKSEKTNDKNNEKTKKSATLADTSPVHRQSALIKIDDVRALQSFIQQSSQGRRFVVIHQADSMTLAAANALLKTLEEPANNVILILLSDTPARLLPTVRSRLQRFEVSKVTSSQGVTYLQSQMTSDQTPAHISQALQISGNAPMVAMDILNSPWYQQRQLWLNSWQALRQGSRQPIQASDYWQSTLSLSDFLYLSQLMLEDIAKLNMQISPLQQDINFSKLMPLPSVMAIHTLEQTIEQIWQDRTQHLQDKLCYDRLMVQFAQI